ncbi:MAG: sulfotransferase, partial [Planctomycetes bacterium]|nr:sulfotransferase [Planctomycetota bacterium]
MLNKLPNFLIIGAAKAGTTAIYAYMKQHPQIFMSPIKETNYFAYDGKDAKTFLGRKAYNDFPIATIAEYAELFKGATNQLVIGEASPLYLESPLAAGRIRELLPEVKLLAILRNPADRAFSDYVMALRLGRGTLAVEDAFEEDEHYVQVGFYYDKLKRYFDLFPREQIKVCLYDDLNQDTLLVVQDIFEYLGVEQTFEPDVASRHNVGGIPKNRI